MNCLPTHTSMGTVDLLVRDLDVMTAYYTEGIGLDVLETGGEVVTLGHQGPGNGGPGNGEPLVRLTRNGDLPAFDRGQAGLFHTAILFDTPADLAAAVLSTARHAPRSFTGSSDHLVSEAFYFDDPEGNGVELYADRPRDQWVYVDGGQVEMATLFLDPNEYLRRHLAAGMPADPGGARVGHVHLQVGSVPEAEAFYSGVLGFDVMARRGSQALFIAAGGYHHHVGLNTWNSAGAGPRAASLGLERLAIEVPDAGEVARIGSRLRGAGLDAEIRTDDGAAGSRLLTSDPWGTRVEIRSA